MVGESAAEVVTVSPTEVMDEESVNVRYYEVEQLPRSKVSSFPANFNPDISPKGVIYAAKV